METMAAGFPGWATNWMGGGFHLPEKTCSVWAPAGEVSFSSRLAEGEAAARHVLVGR